MELPEWHGPTDEAELDAIERKAFADSAALRLHSTKQNRRRNHDGIILAEKGMSFEQEAAAGAKSNQNHIALEDEGGGGSHRLKIRRLPEWSLLSRSCKEHRTKMRYPAIKFGGQIVYSRTVPEAEKATAELLQLIKSNPHTHSGDEPFPMGLDIEWKPTFQRGERPRKAAVIQICVSKSHCFVMHIIHCGIPPLLQSLLEDNSFVKVGVGITNDAAKMVKDYNVNIGALEELSGLANLKLGGTAINWGLGSLTKRLTSMELDKPYKLRCGNWEVNVLSKEQLLYAATDAYVSWYLHQILKRIPENSCGDENPDQVSAIG